MNKIIKDNRICLYLNHLELTETLYKEYVTEEKYFSLKPELFNFKPKIVATATTSNEAGPQTKRKRKHKIVTENDECRKINAELQPMLTEIQKLINDKHKPLEDMARIWEEQATFPQFRGANETNKFQTHQFGHQTYIIPPKCVFYNYNVDLLHELQLEKYDVIIMDLPWSNKYIKRLKKVKLSLAYHMLDNESLKKMPINKFIHSKSLVALWCTNKIEHERALLEEFLPLWDLKLVHKLRWYKVNTEGHLISPLKTEGFKQPYELLFIACHKERDIEDLKDIQQVDVLASIPSIIHSHKPPLIEWLKEYLDNPEEFKGLEIFARYLQPNFTSIGLEVLKLMDKRLYNSSF